MADKFSESTLAHATPFLGLTRWRVTKRRSGLSPNVSASVPLWQSVEATTSLEDLMDELKKNVNGLRVTCESGKTVGIVGNRDVVAAFAA